MSLGSLWRGWLERIKAALPNTTISNGYLIDQNGEIFAHLDIDGVWLYESYEYAERVYRRLLSHGIQVNVINKKTK